MGRVVSALSPVVKGERAEASSRRASEASPPGTTTSTSARNQRVRARSAGYGHRIVPGNLTFFPLAWLPLLSVLP